MMTKIVLLGSIGLIALNAIGSVILIGREREPLTPGTVAFIVAFDVAWILALAAVL